MFQVNVNLLVDHDLYWPRSTTTEPENPKIDIRQGIGRSNITPEYSSGWLVVRRDSIIDSSCWHSFSCWHQNTSSKRLPPHPLKASLQTLVKINHFFDHVFFAPFLFQTCTWFAKCCDLSTVNNHLFAPFLISEVHMFHNRCCVNRRWIVKAGWWCHASVVIGDIIFDCQAQLRFKINAIGQDLSSPETVDVSPDVLNDFG
ncbi:hypothetical protein D3C74_219870 [compost metagenome]